MSVNTASRARANGIGATSLWLQVTRRDHAHPRAPRLARRPWVPWPRGLSALASALNLSIRIAKLGHWTKRSILDLARRRDATRSYHGREECHGKQVCTRKRGGRVDAGRRCRGRYRQPAHRSTTTKCRI